MLLAFLNDLSIYILLTMLLQKLKHHKETQYVTKCNLTFELLD